MSEISHADTAVNEFVKRKALKSFYVSSIFGKPISKRETKSQSLRYSLNTPHNHLPLSMDRVSKSIIRLLYGKDFANIIKTLLIAFD